MSLSNLMGMLQQYAGGGATNTGNVESDFSHVAQNADKDHLASGLAGAFRSNQTPFAETISNLFTHSNGEQQAGILSHLVGAAGPAAGGILGSLGGLVGSSGASQITPEQAQQVSPQAVHDLAQQAEKNNPSVVDQAGSFYAQHPQVVQALGAGALAMIMSHMSQNRR